MYKYMHVLCLSWSSEPRSLIILGKNHRNSCRPKAKTREKKKREKIYYIYMYFFSNPNRSGARAGFLPLSLFFFLS